jgi:hypothetical protein
MKYSKHHRKRFVVRRLSWLQLRGKAFDEALESIQKSSRAKQPKTEAEAHG